MKESTCGIVLTGGLSKRFGSPKAFAERNSKPFYEYSIAALRPFCKAILLSANPPLLSRFRISEKNIHTLPDVELYKGFGPLAGLYSGMAAFSAEWYLIAPIDTPFIGPEIYRQLTTCLTLNDEAVIPVVSGQRQPLIAIYHRSISQRIEGCLATEEKSVHGLLNACNVREVHFEGLEHYFTNINTQADYERYILQIEGECDDQYGGKKEGSMRSHNRQRYEE